MTKMWNGEMRSDTTSFDSAREVRQVNSVDAATATKMTVGETLVSLTPF